MSAVDGRIQHDRLGRAHRERGFPPHSDEPRMQRVPGPIEHAWAVPAQRAAVAREALSHPNPRIVADPGDPGSSLWTWVVEAPGARTVLLWTNPVFDHADPARAELTRLDDSDLWTITLRLPAALRASYRIAVRHDEGTPPWRTAEGRRPVLLAAMSAAEVDGRGTTTVSGSRGEISSVGAGTAAPVEHWRGLPAADGVSRLDAVELAGRDRAWIYVPVGATAPTPLLLLFDGDVWRRELPPILDALIASGILPPVHVAMLDAGDAEHRWESLGVPGGQVDVVIDLLLPLVEGGWNVSTRGEDTIVSGQSLGGIAALWTLALSAGRVGHAIAQSPSLWRFDVHDALAAASGWRSIELQAGTFEGDMLGDAAALSAALSADARTAGRRVTLSPFDAGHDWAVWRANLIGSLIALLG